MDATNVSVVSLVAIILGSNTVTTLLGAWLGRRTATAQLSVLQAAEAQTRADTDATTGGAWRELVQPLRDQVNFLQAELLDLRSAMSSLGQENAILRTEHRAAKEELGILRRLERASVIRTTADTAALKTRLADHGITVPDVELPPSTSLERTRATDHEEQQT